MPTLKRKYRLYILLSSVAVIIYAMGVLLYGWGLAGGIFNSGDVPIAMDSAACFVLTGVALLCQTFIRRGAFIVSRVFAGAVFLWSTMMLIHDFTSVTIPIIFGMAPQTAFSFLCLSFSLFFIKSHKWKPIIQGSLHLVTFIASVATIGYFLDVPEFYEMTFIPMAIYTAICFILLSVAASFINYKTGITALFTGKLIGNLMARRLFLKMLIATLVIGFLRIMAHRREWISPEFDSALIIIIFLLITLSLVWTTSTTLNRIDKKKRLAQENFSIAFDLAPYALILSDSAGYIKLVNERVEKIYGYRRDELIGKPLKTIIPEKLHKDYTSRIESFFASPRVMAYGTDEQFFAVKKDGSEFPIELLLTPVRTSKDIFVLATIIDITQRKHQENIIRNQLIELQFKNEELEQFNYISSHDLQEPLRTVSNYINMLEEDYPEQINDEMREHLHNMNLAIDRMSHVVKSLLNFGKLGRGKKLVLTDSHALINNVISDLDSLIRNSGAAIETEGVFPTFYAYETELRQLFQNLVSNAIKFRKKGTLPEIKIGCKKQDGYFEFFVSDNGIGIDPKQFEKIFHIFHRLNAEAEYEGHGIGLANCKKITEMHGGKIWVESEPGKGSTFRFTILTLKHD